MSRSLYGDESHVYRGVVVWHRKGGESVRKYVGPFVNRVAAVQAINREVGSGRRYEWNENGEKVWYGATAKFVERAPLAWERWEKS